MGYKSKADGIVSKGKTRCDVMPTDGAKVVQTGPKKNSSNLNVNKKTMGRNLARAANQRGR